MLKALGAINTAISTIITSVTGIASSIDNLVSATNHATKALDLTASGMELDVKLDCDKKDHARTKALEEFQAELNALIED